MKRLSLARTLMTKRSVLLLDEPTSGMDSDSALEFVSCLEELATKRNLVVICVIHQPSAQVLEKFPRMIWMEAGELVYQGPTKNIEDYLVSLGLTPPSHLSIVEYMSQLTRNVDTCSLLTDAYKSHIIRLPSGAYDLQYEPVSAELPRNHFTTSPVSRPPVDTQNNRIDESTSPQAVDTDCHDLSHAPSVSSEMIESTDEQDSDSSLEDEDETRSLDGDEAPDNEGRRDSAGSQRRDSNGRTSRRFSAGPDIDYGSPLYAMQVYWLFRRTVRSTLTQSMSPLALCQMIIPGLFLGLVMFQNLRDPTEDDVAKVVLGLIFIGVFSLIKSAYIAMNLLCQDVELYHQERTTSVYPLSAFLLAHSLARIVREALVISVFFLIAAPLAGLRMSPSIFLSTWAILLLVLSVGDAGALLVWSCVNAESEGRFYILLLSQASSLLGGLFAPQSSIPLWCRWLPSVLPWSYAGNVVAQNILWGMTFRCSKSNPGPCPISAQVIIDRFFYWGLSVEQNVCVLAGFAVTFYTLSYLVLRLSGESCNTTSKCRDRRIEAL
eukprot:GHVS01068075.1.p1 GENE.GHVS01068075.1~~GHVS01068075.1.p1  ORF type:complete len:549 (+),score=23.54 GHVS01068075.1:744-2390(+)